ncbi:unnamed protein product [Caenorhabditis bovis]|uniref:SLC12A transporter C-terminal domain-containing protein n=1 Tax=Caenorhabditis bovis TaxID=2654633 RepID=A0A8S1EWR6_9PELO|nr:unnamed protein product [Caenorhabditis bovis]
MSWIDVFLQLAQPMLAVVILLRFSRIVDEAGIVATILMVFIAFSIGLITAWSACTVVSRKSNERGFFKTILAYSCPHFGLSLTVLYLFCLIFITAMFVSAGSEAILHIFNISNIYIIDRAHHDLRIVALALSVIILICSLIRLKIRLPIRQVIFGLTLIAIFLHLSGVLFRYGEYQLKRVSQLNSFIPYPEDPDFGTVFGQLFPATICSLTLLHFGSKLQNSAPRGSLIAVVVCSAIYFVATLFDYIEFFARKSNATTDTITESNIYFYSTVPIALIVTIACVLSGITFLKFAGLVLQALCRSNSSYFAGWLSRGFGPNAIPIRCLIVLHFLQLAISLIGSYDIICIPTSVFVLVLYAFFNFYVFRVKLKKSDVPSPPALVLLFVSAACVFCAFSINRHLTLFAGIIFAIPYCLQLYFQRDHEATKGEAPSRYIPTLEKMHELQFEPENSRHYHPQILLLTGNPAVRPALVDFAHSITRGQTLLVCGYVIPQDPCSRSYLLQIKIAKQINEWIKARDIKAFSSVICCADQADGANTLLQTVGLGRLRPNVLMLGFKTNWEKLGTTNLHIVKQYYSILSNAFEKQVGLIIFRNKDSGFDVSSSIRKDGAPIDDEGISDYVDSQVNQGITAEKPVASQKGKLLSSMQTTFRKMSMAATRDPEMGSIGNKRFQVLAKDISEPGQRVIMDQMSRFRKRIPNARIDVFWLREAGGLTMLVPHLLAHAGSFLEGAHIRVFTKNVDNSSQKINKEQKTMAAILRKCNINSSDLHILSDFSKPPSKKIADKFNEKLAPFKVPRGVDKLPGMFDDDQLFNLREKTRNYLRCAELIAEHSSDADLVVATLPSARPDIPAAIYLSWIDFLSDQKPPVCLVRGNQASLNSLNLIFA